MGFNSGFKGLMSSSVTKQHGCKISITLCPELLHMSPALTLFSGSTMHSYFIVICHEKLGGGGGVWRAFFYCSNIRQLKAELGFLCVYVGGSLDSLCDVIFILS